MIKLCQICGQIVTTNEATAFNNKHENCWIDTIPSIDVKRSKMIAACAEACEQHPEIANSMRKAATKLGLADD